MLRSDLSSSLIAIHQKVCRTCLKLTVGPLSLSWRNYNRYYHYWIWDLFGWQGCLPKVSFPKQFTVGVLFEGTKGAGHTGWLRPWTLSCPPLALLLASGRSGQPRVLVNPCVSPPCPLAILWPLWANPVSSSCSQSSLRCPCPVQAFVRCVGRAALSGSSLAGPCSGLSVLLVHLVGPFTTTFFWALLPAWPRRLFLSARPCPGMFTCGSECHGDAVSQKWYHPRIFSWHISLRFSRVTRTSGTVVFNHVWFMHRSQTANCKPSCWHN